MQESQKTEGHEKEMYIICIVLLVVSLLGVILLNSFGITGAVILEETEIKSEFYYIEPENITRENALNALLRAENDLDEMLSFNLSTSFISDSLLNAKRAYIGEDIVYIREDIRSAEGDTSYLESLFDVARETPVYEVEILNHSEVFRLTQLIAFRKQQAYRILDTITLVEEKEQMYREQGIDTSEGLTLLEEAKISFKDERYNEAEAYLGESGLELDKASSEHKRVKGLLNLSKSFFVRYWWQIIVIVTTLVIITPLIVKKVRNNLAKKKLEALRAELKTITELIKKAQKDCFRDKAITEATYKIRVDRYKSRMIEIKRTIPVLESIVYGEKKKVPEKKKGILEVKK